jgi:hypothetical protein
MEAKGFQTGRRRYADANNSRSIYGQEKIRQGNEDLGSMADREDIWKADPLFYLAGDVKKIVNEKVVGNKHTRLPNCSKAETHIHSCVILHVHSI